MLTKSHESSWRLHSPYFSQGGKLGGSRNQMKVSLKPTEIKEALGNSNRAKRGCWCATELRVGIKACSAPNRRCLRGINHARFARKTRS
jgi:hypothetical protein